MSTSQNGWPVITSGSDARLRVLSWVTGRVLAGPVWTVLDYLARRFNAEVEGINPAWSWGYAYRAIRGATSGYSNHASGTGVDFNAPLHLLGRRGTFTAAQRARIRAILADLDGVVRWGGDYSGRPDEMHFEIVGSPAAVSRVAARITAGTVSNPIGGTGSVPGVVVTAPAPLTPVEDIMATLADLDTLLDQKLATLDEPRPTYRMIEGAAVWLDLGTGRRHISGTQLAARRAPIVDLWPDDPFWDLPIIGQPGEVYRRAGDPTGAAHLLDGGRLRHVTAEEHAALGAPVFVDLHPQHAIWTTFPTA